MRRNHGGGYDSQEKGRRGTTLTRSRAVGLACGCSLLLLLALLLLGGAQVGRSEPSPGAMPSPVATVAAPGPGGTAESIARLRGGGNGKAGISQLEKSERSDKREIARLRERIARLEAGGQQPPLPRGSPVAAGSAATAATAVHGFTTSTVEPAVSLSANLPPSLLLSSSSSSSSSSSPPRQLPPRQRAQPPRPRTPLAFPPLAGLESPLQGGGPARDVRTAIKSCWERYKKDAWGQDELHRTFRVVSCRVVSCRVVSCGVVWCRVMSCRVERSEAER